MLGNVHAELTKMFRRPATWLLISVAFVLSATFAYLVPYAGFAGGTEGPPNSDRGLAATLPDQLIGNSIGGSPVFVGALALILGVLVVGGEYAWGTWKTVLGQGVSRMTVYVAKLVAVAVSAFAMTLSCFAAGAVASPIIASLEDQPISWPGIGDLIVGVGAGWLVTMMWATLGVLLAIAFRAVALPVGLGLVWLLAVQNLVASLAAPLIDWVADLQTGLPGPNAGSLVAALGANPTTPGVAEMAGAGQAALVVGGYLVAFAAVGGWLLSRRDII